MTGKTYFLLFLLPSTANMRQIVAVLDRQACWCSIVTSVQTEMLRVLFCWLGTHDHDAIQGSTEQTYIMTVCPVNDESQGNSCPIGEATTFGSALAAIGGIGSSCGFAERGFRYYSVYCLPFPLDPLYLIVLFQSGLPESLEETSLLPLLKAVMYC
jgi:hypothetical protein